MTASFADQEIWHVLVASDDMKRMNVDQLDDAFRLDIVDASTMVWKNGMEKWRRLGSIAGIDEELETIARPIAPPVRSYPAPPRPHGPPSAPPAPRPRPTSRAANVNPFDATVNPFASTTPAGVFDTAKLLAPVYTPPLYSPDPYVLPKRRVTVPSDVDFRRAPGIRWGRWLFAFLLITSGVLGAYRQNLLREGARRLGVEGRYLSGERRVTAFVSAKAPPPVRSVLTRLALLPGPNAAPVPALRPSAPAALPAAPETVEASTSTAPATDSSVKTVSLDQLPTEAAAPAVEPTPAVRSAPATRSAPIKRAALVAKAEPQAATRQEKPVVEAEAPVEKPKPAAKAPPPAMNDTPLKAAIWKAMQADANKK